MQIDWEAAETSLAAALSARQVRDAADVAGACVWLEACSYAGLQMLAEALGDDARDANLARDAIGIDLKGVSCVFLAPRIMSDVRQNGRVFLRNVRHGLYLLPFTVRDGLGIGCPVDPSFAVGGTRAKNPYDEKIAAARAQGLALNDTLWSAVHGAA